MTAMARPLAPVRARTPSTWRSIAEPGGSFPASFANSGAANRSNASKQMRIRTGSRGLRQHIRQRFEKTACVFCQASEKQGQKPVGRKDGLQRREGGERRMAVPTLDCPVPFPAEFLNPAAG